MPPAASNTPHRELSARVLLLMLVETRLGLCTLHETSGPIMVMFYKALESLAVILLHGQVSRPSDKIDEKWIPNGNDCLLKSKQHLSFSGSHMRNVMG